MSAQAFWSRVAKSDDCWLWTGARNGAGYGMARMPGSADTGKRAAHRVAFELLVGPIADGNELDHLCRIRACVNPAHLEPVAPGENRRRQAAAQTHCKQGHEFTRENTQINPSGFRKCRACNRPGARRERAASRIEVAA